MSNKSTRKKPKLESCLNNEFLEKWIKELELRDLSIFEANIHDLVWSWLGNVDKNAIEYLFKQFPFLQYACDKDKILARFEIIDQFEKSSFGIHINDFFPELSEIRIKLHERLNSESSGIERAELWLLPIALGASADSASEALIYFASRGEILISPDEIRKRWHEIICSDIQRGSSFRNIPESVKARAKNNLISLTEASEVLNLRGDLPRFFMFRDEEEDFIDASFLRTVEWLNVEGFDPWVQSTIRDISSYSQNGIEHYYFAWTLFHLSRSNLLLEKADKIGLSSLIWALINGPIEKDKPWIVSWSDNESDFSTPEYIPIASIIVFAWNRIEPSGINIDIIGKAITVLYSNQLSDGSWPIVSNNNEGNIMSTCFAIHALCLEKPLGWEKACENAVNWLKTEQNPSGYWYIPGGPITMMTVLALDSISLVENGRTTFDKQNKISTTNIKSSKNWDFKKETWFKKRLPQIQSKPIEEIKEIIKPKIAIICAVEIELKHILKELEPANDFDKIIKVNDNTETYYLGKFGSQTAVICMSSMGSQGATGATLSVDSLIRTWNPIVITMVGIAFGMDKTKHKPGDVLIADSIIPYENQKVNKGEINFRNPIPVSSQAMINRYRNAFDWEFYLPDGTKVARHFGALLSGEKLINDPEFKKKLLSNYPNAIGGEMESTGVWSSASKHNKQWIVLKSVCDWADGEKNDDLQALAAASSVSLCKFIFNDDYILSGMN